MMIASEFIGRACIARRRHRAGSCASRPERPSGTARGLAARETAALRRGDRRRHRRSIELRAANTDADAGDILDFQIEMLGDDALTEPALAAIADGAAGRRTHGRRCSARRSPISKPPKTNISAPAPPICAIFTAASCVRRRGADTAATRPAPSSWPTLT